MNTMASLSTRDIVFTSIIAAISVVGLVANGLAMFVLIKGGKIGNSFQQLCFSHSLANFIAVNFFLFYCCPVILMKSNFPLTSSGKMIGGFMVAIWDISVYSHLLSAVNRLLVISWPVRSRDFLSQKTSNLMIAIIWALGILHFIPYTLVDKCYIIFNSTSYLWYFAPNLPCSFILGDVLDFYNGVAMFCLIIIFDLWTLYRIGKLKQSTMSRSSSIRRDVKFFIQSCIQFLLFVVKLICFYFISTFFMVDQEKYHTQLFFSTSFVWQAVHCLDGVVLVPFHWPDYIKRKKQRGVVEISNTNVFVATHRPTTSNKNSVDRVTNTSN